jgi:hypothetical protein
LVALGAKSIETRSWSTDYCGPLAIHASKGFPKEYRDLCRENPFYTALTAAMSFPKGVPCYRGYTDFMLETPEKYLPLGAIVAVCDLVRVKETPYLLDLARISVMTHLSNGYEGSNLLERANQELAFGDYSEDRYMWLLANVRALENPIPAKGSLGLWETDLRRFEFNKVGQAK